MSTTLSALRPNPSLKRSANGRPPGPVSYTHLEWLWTTPNEGKVISPTFGSGNE